jgi:hypothetical protein
MENKKTNAGVIPARIAVASIVVGVLLAHATGKHHRRVERDRVEDAASAI